MPAVQAPGHGHHRRMARADGQQARRAGAAGAGAAAAVAAGTGGLGPVGDHGQPGQARRMRCWARDRACWSKGERQGDRGRHADAEEHRRAFPWGGHLGIPMLQAGDRTRSTPAHVDAGLHQHPFAVGDLVPEPAGRTAGLGRADRAAPRLARQGRARLGGTGHEGRQPESGGLHVQPGPGRRLPAGRAGAADRQRQGHRPAAAARRAQRPRAGPPFARHAGADQQPGAAGSGRRAAGR